MRVLLLLVWVGLFDGSTEAGAQRHHADDTPAQYSGVAAGAELSLPRTVRVESRSRRPDDPATPAELEAHRAKVLRALKHTALRPVATEADLELTLIDEPHLRWGMYHYQNDFYAFLEVRERSTRRLLYCSYRRAGFLHSATSGLLAEFVAATRHAAAAQPADLDACARLAEPPARGSVRASFSTSMAAVESGHGPYPRTLRPGGEPDCRG